MIFAIHVLLALMTSTPVSSEHTVGIRVELHRCGDVRGVEIVLEGNEETQFALSPEDPGGHVWVGTWTHSHQKRNSPQLPASLRFKNGRSYGRVAQLDTGLMDEPIAKFVFTCDDAPVLNLDIKTIQPTVFGYERRLPVPVAQGDGLDWDGPENGTVASGFRVIKDLRFPAETLLVQFHNAGAKARTSDLTIFNPGAKDTAVAVTNLFDPYIMKNATTGPAVGCPAGAICMSRRGLVAALGQQRARDRRLLVPQEYDSDEANLAKLDVLTLTVK
jgi:hypothetical protein